MYGNVCLFRQYSLYMEIKKQANINSYVSLISKINYKLLYNKFLKFRDKMLFHILKETFP